MSFNCKCCNYKTNSKYNYNRHLDTFKHHKNQKIRTNVLKTRTNVLKTGTNVLKTGTNVLNSDINFLQKLQNNLNCKYQCKLCNYICNYNKDYNKHCKTKNHKNMVLLKKKFEKERQLFKMKMNLLLQQKEDKLHQQENELEEKDIIIKCLNQELLIKTKDIKNLESKVDLLSEIKDLCKKNKKSVMKIIINNYNNAPDFTAQPIHDMSNEDFKRYIDMGIPNGIVEMLKDYYIENIPNEKRSLWCIDGARIKYLIRKDNNWKVDLMGKFIKKIMVKPLQSKILDMLNTNILSTERYNGLFSKYE